MEVVLGTNRFIDCGVILSLKGLTLFRVGEAPLSLSVETPPEAPMPISIVNNIGKPAPDALHNQLRVLALPQIVQAFWGDFLIASLTQLEPTRVHAQLDFRPIGINCFSDLGSLHVGNSGFSGSTFNSLPVAINLG